MNTDLEKWHVQRAGGGRSQLAWERKVNDEVQCTSEQGRSKPVERR